MVRQAHHERILAYGNSTTSPLVLSASKGEVAIFSQTLGLRLRFGLGPEEDLASAAEVMRRRRIKRLPIASNGELLGIVSLSDLARFAASDLKASMRLICSLIEAPQTATITPGL